MRILVTGGAGFIGSHLIIKLMQNPKHQVVNLDALTYAGNLSRLKCLQHNSRYRFYQCDLNESIKVQNILHDFEPEAIYHLAAETHVDRSIKNADNFIKSNILGTYNLLENVRIYLQRKPPKSHFRFMHISTDEVYGDLDFPRQADENYPYLPNSPYAASKASSNHLVRTWHKTYDIPTIITNCSNNYGPKQHPEKLIPKIIFNALNDQQIPIYGDGSQIRNWLYVEDHINALIMLLTDGKIGESYNIGSFDDSYDNPLKKTNAKTLENNANSENQQEISNLQLTKMICDLLQQLKPKNNGKYHDLINLVADRKAHDQRYALNCHKLQHELNWQPKTNLQTGLLKTIKWYLDNLYIF